MESSVRITSDTESVNICAFKHSFIYIFSDTLDVTCKKLFIKKIFTIAM